MADRVDLQTPQRQSLWAVVFLALRTVRQIGVIQIAVFIGFVVARLPSVLAFLGLVAAVALVLFLVAALQWWRYTFVIIGDELVVSRGIAQQQRLTVPLDRVQSVSLEQKLLHRFVSLVQVSLDTAGTQQAEFVIDAVDRPVAEALQRAAASHRRAPIDGPVDVGMDAAVVMPPPPERTVLRHSPRRIAKIALTQTPFAGLVLFAPLFAFGNSLGDLVERIPVELPEVEEPTVGWWLAWAIPLFLLVALVLAVLLNLVRVALTDWNLTLRSTATGLRRDAGLLSTTSVATTMPRVQTVRTRQSFLERVGSLHTVQLGTIGNVRLVIPGCEINEVSAIRDLVFAESEGVDQLEEAVASEEVFLATRNASVLLAVISSALWLVVGWWSLLLFVFVPYVWASTRRRVRLRRWGTSPDSVASHREFLSWDRHELLWRKINGVTLRQSLFERKRDLATVTLATASGAISIGMIPLGRATQLRDEALYRVETDRRSWM